MEASARLSNLHVQPERNRNMTLCWAKPVDSKMFLSKKYGQ
jgi:hypothetical protein